MGEEFKSKWHKTMLKRFNGDDVALANFMRESAKKAAHKNHRGGFNAMSEEEHKKISQEGGKRSGEERRAKSNASKKQSTTEKKQPTIKTPITSQAQAIEAIEKN